MGVWAIVGVSTDGRRGGAWQRQLTTEQQNQTRQTVTATVDGTAEIYVFGSRVDAARGGEVVMQLRFDKLCQSMP